MKTLIIKIGALGDVLRTTPLLHRLQGNVTWVTDRRATPLLAGNKHLARVIAADEAGPIKREKFDWVINFDESREACLLASSVKAVRKTGALLRNGSPAYCERSAPWFDMSLISRLGIRKADRLKYASRKTYQHFLFKACGFSFTGEEYLLARPAPASASRTVAIEMRTGPKWPLKYWPGYEALIELFKEKGVDFFILRQRRMLRDYISDINRCSILLSGDTLAMHIALALRKRAVAVFNCTSPWEIYGYGRLSKIVDSKLGDFFYSTRAAGVDFKGVAAETVFRAAVKALKKPVLSARV
jgi:heptosyltransferase-2